VEIEWMYYVFLWYVVYFENFESKHIYNFWDQKHWKLSKNGYPKYAI